MQSASALPTPATDRGTAVWAAILGITLYRAVLCLFDRTELSTDEAQYWFWGQHLAFGAYSKPPLIGWLLRGATEVFGQSVWAVRLPAALIHGVAASVLYVVARRLAPPPVAGLAALGYLTAPAVALGSALMTTDTPMLLAAVVAMLAQLRLAEARAAGRPGRGWAVVFGLALGLGLLAKHAMLFWFAGAAAAAVLSPGWRIGRGDAALAGAVLLAAVAPHVAWLAGHGFVTLVHVQDITEGAGGGLSAQRPAQFLVEQLAVMGPLMFPAMLLAIGGRGGWRPGLAALALVPLLIVVAQGVKGPVLANWAVLYLLPGAVLAAFVLAAWPRLARVSLLLGLLVTLALPLVKIAGTGLAGQGGGLLLARYLGHGELARWALAQAGVAGARTLVAHDRDLLADLSWFGAGSGLAIRAVPPQGAPGNHWEMTAPFRPGADAAPVLLLWREGRPPPCPGATEVARHPAGPGFAGGAVFVLLRLDDPACLAQPEALP